MNILYLSFRNILSKPLSSMLSWLLLGFGVTIVSLILLISDQLEREISKNAAGIDLVIGAKGSPLQIILANIFHIDFPTGNIPLAEASKISHNRYIASAIPVSLGDAYSGFRIVGTTVDYPALYEAGLQEGEWFAEPMDAVIGALVAVKLHLKIGDEFQSQHGLTEDGDAHDAHPFRVVGIMKSTGSVMDQLILTGLASIWEVHDHEGEEEHHEEHGADSLISIPHLGIEVTDEQLAEKEITALLVKYKSPMGAVTLPRSINSNTSMQAASPAYETARLFNILGVGIEILQILGVMIIAISAISVFVALLNSLKDRKFDLAMMRTMGATNRQVFVLILAEGLLITLAGAVSGLLVAHTVLYVLGSVVSGFTADAFHFITVEWIVLAGCLLVGILAAAAPALMAYKTDISDTLSKS